MRRMQERDLEGMETLEPGTFFRITQVIELEGGLLYSPDPDSIFWGAVEGQRRELAKLGYEVVLDRHLTAPLPGHPFLIQNLEEIGGPISGWIPDGVSDAGEPIYEMTFQWFLADVQDPDPEVLLAGFPVLYTVIGASILLLLGGTAVVLWQARLFFVDAGDEALELAEEATTSFAIIGAVIIVALLLTSGA